MLIELRVHTAHCTVPMYKLFNWLSQLYGLHIYVAISNKCNRYFVNDCTKVCWQLLIRMMAPAEKSMFNSFELRNFVCSKKHTRGYNRCEQFATKHHGRCVFDRRNSLLSLVAIRCIYIGISHPKALTKFLTSII